MKRSAVVASITLALLTGVVNLTASPVSAVTTRTTESFPVTVKVANGAVVVPTRPTRIVSVSASSTEMLYAIGAGPQVVAVDKYSTDPPNAPRTGLTGYESSAEDYVRYRPDLVVLAFDESGLMHQLQILHIPVILMPPALNIHGTYAQFEQLGIATGHESAAVHEVARIKSQLASIVRSVGNTAKGLTYYQEIDPTLYTATSKTFIGALYASLGMVNIADAAGAGGDGYPQLSAEYLIHANPDLVFLADDQCCGQSAKTFAKRPGFSVLKAVRLGDVFTIPDPIASEWGTRVVEFLRLVAADVKKAVKTHSVNAH